MVNCRILRITEEGVRNTCNYSWLKHFKIEKKNRKPVVRRHIVRVLHDPRRGIARTPILKLETSDFRWKCSPNNRSSLCTEAVRAPYRLRTISVESLLELRDDCTEIVRCPCDVRAMSVRFPCDLRAAFVQFIKISLLEVRSKIAR